MCNTPCFSYSDISFSQEITKKAGEAWNSLSEHEKTPYYKDAQVIRAKWERDLENYKQAVGSVMGKKTNVLLFLT